MQLVELTENGVSDLLSHIHCQPILQVVNLSTQPNQLTRLALSDGKKFLQTLAPKDLINRLKIERLALIKVLNSSLEGESRQKVVFLRDMEKLKSLTYVVGTPTPVSQMTVTVEEEIKERDNEEVRIGEFKCKGCGETLAAVRAAMPFKLVFRRLTNCSVIGGKRQMETETGIQLLQTVACICGSEVGVYYLASDTEALRGKYQLQASAIHVITIPDCSDQPHIEDPIPPAEGRLDDLILQLQGDVSKVISDFGKRVNFLETVMKRTDQQVKSLRSARK